MPPDEDEPRPRYSGPFVTLRPVDGFTWTVGIEPILPTGEGEPLAFGSKHDAWWQVLTFAREHRLPVRDLTDGHVSAHHDE